MESPDIDPATLRTGFALGFVIVAAIAAIITAVVGADAILVVLVALAAGIVVGGPIGALFLARVRNL